MTQIAAAYYSDRSFVGDTNQTRRSADSHVRVHPNLVARGPDAPRSYPEASPHEVSRHFALRR